MGPPHNGFIQYKIWLEIFPKICFQGGFMILGDPYGNIFSQVHMIKLGDFPRIEFQANLDNINIRVKKQSYYKTKGTLNGFYIVLFMKILFFFSIMENFLLINFVIKSKASNKKVIGNSWYMVHKMKIVLYNVNVNLQKVLQFYLVLELCFSRISFQSQYITFIK